jgi:hypothetical protein
VPLGVPGEADMLTRVVRVVRGTIDVSVPTGKREPTALMIRGPGKMSLVTKAGFATFVASDDRSTAACRSGNTLVGVGNDWRILKEGFARTLAASTPTALPRPILGRPTPSFDHGLVFVRDSETGNAIASWQPVKDADRYDVHVGRVDGSKIAPFSHELTTSTSAPLRALSPGTYSVVVTAIDKTGLLGMPSQPKELRVSGLETPKGASVGSDGAIVLAKEQRVRLLASEGLEVSYGTSQIFGPAPSTLGLAHGESVVARIRAPGTTEETFIRLEPRGLRARVQLSPTTASWPRDSVTVTVEPYDTSGRPIPDENLTTTVTVNLERVKLAWQRDDHALRAVIPASATRGPWVIRAEVRDGRGELLGRDFLEVLNGQTGRAIANR